MAGFASKQGLAQVALDYAAIAAISLGILMLFLGYPRRGAELLLTGTGLLVLKYLLSLLSRRKSRPVEVYRNIILVNAEGRELPSKLVHLTGDRGFTLGQAGEQLRIGEVVKIRVDHFQARGRIAWVNGAWAGGNFIDDDKFVQKVAPGTGGLRTDRADWPIAATRTPAKLTRSS